jgi:hypothetical protein
MVASSKILFPDNHIFAFPGRETLTTDKKKHFTAVFVLIAFVIYQKVIFRANLLKFSANVTHVLCLKNIFEN